MLKITFFNFPNGNLNSMGYFYSVFDMAILLNTHFKAKNSAIQIINPTNILSKFTKPNLDLKYILFFYNQDNCLFLL